MYLSQTIYTWIAAAPIFKSAFQLGLIGADAIEWDLLRDYLRSAGFCYAMGGDRIVWNGPLMEDTLIAQEIYRILMPSLYRHMQPGFSLHSGIVTVLPK